MTFLIFIKRIMTQERTHTCTSCKKTIFYTNSGSWYNARKNLKDKGTLRCPQCAGTEGREASSIKPVGRAKGSKNRDNTNVRLAAQTSPNRYKFSSLTKEQRLKGIAKRNGYETYEEYQTTLSDWEKYKNEVWRITNQQPLTLLENFDKRGQSGIGDAYQIDHMYSILKGFKNQIPPALIGDIKNLQMLPWLENLQKGWK